MSKHIVFFWPFLLEQRFRLAVPLLLFPVGPHSIAAMMPDHGCSAKANGPTLLLQAPAHIHVIAGRTKLWIKPPNSLQSRFAKRHVTPWNMLCLGIGEEYMHGPPRGIRHTVGYHTVTRRGQIRSPDAHMRRTHESRRDIGQPVWIRIGVVINIGHNFTLGLLPAGIARAAQAAVFRANQSKIILRYNLRGGIGGAIIDHNHFKARILEPQEPFTAISDRARSIVTTYHNRDVGPGKVR